MSKRETYDANLVDVWLVCDEPICKDDLVLVHRFARMAQSEHAARLEAEARVERLEIVATKARGLVRTAHPEVGKNEIVRQWWDSLVEALASLETRVQVAGVFEQMGMDEPRFPETKKGER